MSNSISAVRVRFAPSPTGYLHVGGVRTCLFNWLLARRHGGKLILRIEDTDQARSTRESERLMLDDLAALGLGFDEGPDAGGPHAPYRQSERMDIYRAHAARLLDAGHAYYCFCSADLITQKRSVALKMGKTPHYDGTCARIPRAEAEARIARGEAAGLRFRAPERDLALDDEVRGRVEFKSGTVGDFLIMRSPRPEEVAAEGARAALGMPVYNFCCAVDDHLMAITHVIRSEEHLSNTPRQLMIYEAFGWTPPRFAHASIVLGADRQKLSKRNGDASAHDYLEKGYLPEALLNFLALLGWWPPAGTAGASGHPEVLTVDELARAFELSGLQKAAAVFDTQKLRWMNGHYLKALPLAEAARRARPFFGEQADQVGAATFEKIIEATRADAHLLSELPAAGGFFFTTDPELEDEARARLASAEGRRVAEALERAVRERAGEEIAPDDVKPLVQAVGAAAGAKGKDLFMPVRAAVTGRTHGPELNRVLPILGKAGALARIASTLRRAADGARP